MSRAGATLSSSFLLPAIKDHDLLFSSMQIIAYNKRHLGACFLHLTAFFFGKRTRGWAAISRPQVTSCFLYLSECSLPLPCVQIIAYDKKHLLPDSRLGDAVALLSQLPRNRPARLNLLHERTRCNRIYLILHRI